MQSARHDQLLNVKEKTLLLREFRDGCSQGGGWNNRGGFLRESVSVSKKQTVFVQDGKSEKVILSKGNRAVNICELTDMIPCKLNYPFCLQ